MLFKNRGSHAQKNKKIVTNYVFLFINNVDRKKK